MTASPLKPDPAYRTVADLVREHARTRPDHAALVQGDDVLTYAALDTLMNRVAASLQRDGFEPGDAVAICAHSSPRYAAVFLGALRAGLAVAPLAPSVTPESFASMRVDAQARWLFADSAALEPLAGTGSEADCISLDGAVHGRSFEAWLMPEGARPEEVEVPPEAPFNIIYSSGTTGLPKGIVQSHGMRWSHITRGANYRYGPKGVTLLATPLYSNTTLVVFFPTIGFGGCVVLMAKFDAAQYLALAEKHRMTHTMLVPVQYQRIMGLPQFGAHDLSSTLFKFCTSAPFGAASKADVLARWPGGLVEFYGMTEGGGTCILVAQEHPDKLHTVGQPALGHDIRLIDDAGHQLPQGSGDAGEVVGHSAGMMTGYHRQPEKTREAEWFAPDGKRFIRTGDVGRFDADGFLVLMDRKKDMVISGGFNVYPSDLEAVLREHPAVADAAVVGVSSVQWGETPVAFVVRRELHDESAEAILQWLNQRVGKIQRLADLRLLDELPRSAIGKVLKRELRDAYEIDPDGARKKLTRPDVFSWSLPALVQPNIRGLPMNPEPKLDHAVHLRPYAPSDWQRLCQIHDSARMGELRASGLEAAFLDLEATAESEGLFEGHVTVAEIDGDAMGFVAYSDGELTWLYVDPRSQRQGVGRALVRHAVEVSDGPLSVEVLAGNDTALNLYKSEGFIVVRRVDGRLTGNEEFAASGYVLQHANSVA